jgi:hypothetical protein
MRHGVLPVNLKQNGKNSEWVGERSPSAEETQIPKVTVNAQFYKGVMDRLLKRIQRVCPVVICSRDSFLVA